MIYGDDVPFVLSLWKPFHWKDMKTCQIANPKAKFVVIDAAVQDLCARIVDAYAIKRKAVNQDEQSIKMSDPIKVFKPHVRPDFSTGMEAVTVALALCSKISIFGFGTVGVRQHHYFENKTLHEYGLHDYAAERMYFADLATGTPPLVIGGRVPIPNVQFVE